MKALRFRYMNHRGVEKIRTVRPIMVWFGESQFYEGEHFFMDARDVETDQCRSFMIARMKGIEEVEVADSRLTSAP